MFALYSTLTTKPRSPPRSPPNHTCHVTSFRYIPVNGGTTTCPVPALFEADASLPNALNPEQRRRFYGILVALDPSLVGPAFPDTQSAIAGVANKQVKLHKFCSRWLLTCFCSIYSLFIPVPSWVQAKSNKKNGIQRRGRGFHVGYFPRIATQRLFKLSGPFFCYLLFFCVHSLTFVGYAEGSLKPHTVTVHIRKTIKQATKDSGCHRNS